VPVAPLNASCTAAIGIELLAAFCAICAFIGLGNRLIEPRTTVTGTGQVTCRDRLGGLLKFYDREAA